MKVNTFSDELTGKGMKFAIVRSRFNQAVTDRMLEGCENTLTNSGADDIEVHEVPGSFEIPLAVQLLLKKGGYDAIITLGCIQRGETPHDRYIANAVIPALTKLSLDYSVPVILGIITPVTLEQADERSTGESNKGIEAAKAALELVQVLRQI